MKKMSIILSTILAIFVIGLLGSYWWIMSNIEQPDYQVISTDKNIQIRHYKPMIIAEVVLAGERKAAIRQGFNLLAAYIFGDNRLPNNIATQASSSSGLSSEDECSRKAAALGDLPASEKIAMSSPVQQQASEKIAMSSPVQQQASEKIAMSSPVQQQASAKIAMSSPVQQQASAKIAMTSPVQQQEADNLWKVSFIMPAKYNMRTLPIPNEPRVVLTEVPAKKFVVIKFSGTSSDNNVAKYKQKLLDHIQNKQIKVIGSAKYAFYDPPWTLPFMRRNEIMIELGD